MPGSECDLPRLPEGQLRKPSRQEFKKGHQEHRGQRAHDERRQGPVTPALAGEHGAGLRLRR